MSEQLTSRLHTSQQKLKINRQILNNLNIMLKKQAMRSLKLQQIFKFSKSDEELFQKIYGNNNLETYEDYSKLLSKRISMEIDALLKELESHRNTYVEIQTDIRNKIAKEKILKDIAILESDIENTVGKITKIWRKQCYLLLNYRMDIVAKDLEKWSRGIGFVETCADPAKVQKLFKP